MTRAATVPGDQPAHPSGGYAIVQVPAPVSAQKIAEKIVTNPVYKVMAGAIVGLIGLLCTVLIIYISSEVSKFNTRMDSGDQHDLTQDREIKDLSNWRIKVSAQGGLYELYSKALGATLEYSKASTDLLREIKDRLPPPRK